MTGAVSLEGRQVHQPDRLRLHLGGPRVVASAHQCDAVITPVVGQLLTVFRTIVVTRGQVHGTNSPVCEISATTWMKQMAKHCQTPKDQKTPLESGIDESKEGPPTNGNPILAPVGMIVQSFAVFVALSILMGRVYFLAYYRELGVPISDIHLNVFDYAVISPKVAIFSVGCSLIVAGVYWFRGQAELARVPRRGRISAGVILCFISAFLFAQTAYDWFSESGDQSIVYTAVMLLALLLVSFGAAFLDSGLKRDVQRTELSDSAIKLLAPIFLISALIIAITVATGYAEVIGISDALSTLDNTPEADVELTSASAHDALRYGSDECNTDPPLCRFGVVMIGEEFVYLRTLIDDSWSERILGMPSSFQKERLYAVPIDDVISITYLAE